MSDRKLPIGIQDFKEIRENHYVYVDKTEYIWKLVNSGKAYFLSRPRRFGKSLLLSTMENYFSGRKELFMGLAIDQYEQSKSKDVWVEYPVVTFMLSGGDYHSPNGLSDAITAVLNHCIKQYGLVNEYEVTGETLPIRFKNMIEQLYAKYDRQVVVLVDEYDKPLLETMTVNEEQEEENRRLYKSFFSVLKDEDQYLKFVFFTGVTKFSKVSIFSDLNQLRDISLSDDYSGICGITEDELTVAFEPEVEKMTSEQNMSEQACLDKLARMYDGYHFSKKGAGVYNPFSLLNAFQDRDFGRYWFSTATPTFLVNKLQNSNFSAEQFADGVQATEMSLMDFQEQNPDPIPLFYQSGYLTICGWNARFRVFDLRFPNDEVKYGFMNSLADVILPKDENRPGLFVMNFVQDLENGNVQSFMDRLSAIFASIPYPERPVKSYESEWRNEIYLILALLGMNVHCEVHTSRGRADCAVETIAYVYIFEFKLDQTAEVALQQIEERHYSDQYRMEEKTIYEIGVNFSSAERNIEQWKMKKM